MKVNQFLYALKVTILGCLVQGEMRGIATMIETGHAEIKWSLVMLEMEEQRTTVEQEFFQWPISFFIYFFNIPIYSLLLYGLYTKLTTAII